MTTDRRAPGQDGRTFPYIVVRLMAGVYQLEKIRIETGPPEVLVKFRATRVRHPEPFDADGGVSPGCRELLITGLIEATRRTRFNMCLVWARDDCTFVSRNDGSVTHSKEPPSGGFGSGGLGGKPIPIDIPFDEKPRQLS